MTDEIEHYLRNVYAPRSVYSPGVADWARELVIASRPASTGDGRSLCSRICNFGEWLIQLGYTLSEPVSQLFGDGNITAYLAETFGGDAVGTVDTTGSAIRRVRRAVTHERRVVVTGGRRDVDGAVIPVSDAEVARFQGWVRGIDESSVHRIDGLVLVALIRGAGCTKADLGLLTVDCVEIQYDASVVLRMRSGIAREVVVEPKWADPLVQLASRGTNTNTGAMFEIGRRARTGTSALKGLENRYYRQRNQLPERAAAALPPFLNVNTYRAAWLLDCLAAGKRLDHLLREAGLVSAAALDRYLQFLPESVAPKRAR